MTPETFIQTKAAEAIKSLYGADVEQGSLQVQVTRKEFEGDYTLVVFPLLKVSHSSPENTGKAIGEWLRENVSEIAGYNCVKGFLNISFSPLYWNELFNDILSDNDFGQLPSTGQNIMVEFFRRTPTSRSTSAISGTISSETRFQGFSRPAATM